MTLSPWFQPLSLVAVIFVVYLNSFWGAFQFDDYNVIVDNPNVYAISAWLSDLPHGIRPLLKLTYMLNWTTGLGLFGFHLFNLAIHAINAILIYFFSLRFTGHYPPSATHSKNIAFLAALLFALHPVQTEAVTYISGRSTSLMAMFYLGSILAYIHGSDKNKRLWLYFVSPLFFIMAVLTKEVSVTLPLALMLWEATFSRSQNILGIALRKQAIHWAILICILIIFIAYPPYENLLEYSFEIRSLKDNLLSQINGVTYLISRLAMINRLNIDPDLPIISTWTNMLAAKTVMLAALLLTGIIAIRKLHWFGFSLLWFFLHIMPTNSFVPRLDIANERQLYLAAWGIFLSASFAIEQLKTATQKYQQWILTGTMLLLLTLGCFTVMRNHTYLSEIALWEDTVRKSPNKARVYNNLGYAYAVVGRDKDAEKAYLAALSLNPDYVLPRNNLAVISGTNSLKIHRQ